MAAGRLLCAGHGCFTGTVPCTARNHSARKALSPFSSKQVEARGNEAMGLG